MAAPTIMPLVNIIPLVNVMPGAGELILKTTGVPTNGAAGTYAGVIQPGGFIRDTATNIAYHNTGTLAAPVWTTP